MKTKNLFLIGSFLTFSFLGQAQLSPAITSWLQNTSVTGTYYVSGNSTALSNGILVNCQSVKYSTNWVYINTKGVPSYTTGPFLDGNTTQASDQNAIYRFPRNPTQNTGVPTATTGGNIGVFINGVAFFDYGDAASWNLSQNKMCGGPIMSCSGDGIWNRDAVVAERPGFDCSKGHPALGKYHHHQNPSAYKNDLVVLSTICNLYNADGMYSINSSVHSPLIGFAYDGFPVYGPYGYTNTNGTGGITRIKSSYQLRNITVRTHYSNGTDVADGPPISSTYPLGTFREDYEYVSHSGQGDYLDEHNGRFCVTPDYPTGTYCYFATVDANWNSAYPYLVGPTFYGNKVAAKVNSITESVTTYTPSVVPLYLSNLQGKLLDKTIGLSWSNLNSNGAEKFTIEKSTDGIVFGGIGEINDVTNINTSSFSFIDNTVFNKQYYRIKITLTNGTIVYSNVISVYGILNGGNEDFSVFPNPASDFVAVQALGLVRKNINLQLYDMQGKLLGQSRILQGSTMGYIDLQTIYNGTYILKVSNEDFTLSKKVIVQK
jgi:hypothetical protein